METNKKKDEELKRDLESTSGEFNPDSGFRLQNELISGESRKQVGFADSWIAD